MTMTMTKTLVSLAVAAVLLTVGLSSPWARTQQATPSDLDRQVDRVFERWSSTTPGCAVAVSVDGQRVLSKAYGMADLEHDVAEHARHDFRSRIGIEAVHSGRRAAPGTGRQAIARRSGPEVRARTARLRLAPHDSPHVESHQRPARLGQRGGHCRLASHDARVHARACARHRGPSALAELYAWHQSGRTATRDTTWRPSSCPGSAACRSRISRASASSNRWA